MQRRGFVKLCASAAAAVGVAPERLAEGASGPLKRYPRVRLVGADRAPLRAADLAVGESYVFNYPFVATPCFLLDLGRPVSRPVTLRTEDGAQYTWQGGVGAKRSIVAFSAICAHKMSHPAKSVSFINYRHQPVSFRDRDERLVRRKGVIFCCSEKSVYDPARGSEVLGGPAKQPLCTIVLEHDAGKDALYAVASYGGEMFEQFFAKFSLRLQLEHGRTDVDASVTGTTPVVTIAQYSRHQMMCGA